MAAGELPTTQRAYTLRLRGATKEDKTWREALWATHEAVNKGAKAFGDWLLTLRGGLDHRLADAEKDADKRRQRRILLALSWLSVESEPRKTDGYGQFVVATGKDLDRADKVVAALRTILTGRGIEGNGLGEWLADCSPSLRAEIRADAVWVNRSAAFDAAQKRVGKSLTRDEVWDILEPFFGSQAAYLAPVKAEEDDDGSSGRTEEKAKDLVQKAGGWLSSRFGAGKGADFQRMSKVYEAIATWAARSKKANVSLLAEALTDFGPASPDAEGVLGLISGPGYKSATRNLIAAWSDDTDLTKLRETAAADAELCAAKVGGKGRRPWSDALLAEVEDHCGFTYLQKDGPARHREFSVMLDHAARRVSIAHSWIKRAEAERATFEEDARRIACVPEVAKAWLGNFCKARGALDGYRIRKRAIQGWKQVVDRWARTECKTPKDRIAAAFELQADPEIEKFGDIQLFEALAADDAVCVWQPSGKPDPQPLTDYVAASDAEAKRRRFKVPAYRHPDPLLHPVFCDFGNSRWEIRFDIHEMRKSQGKKQRAGKLADAHPHGLHMGLWDGKRINEGIAMRWGSKRLSKDLGLRQVANGEPLAVTRADRLGRAAAGTGADVPVKVLGLFEQEDWNGRLQAPRRELDDIARQLKKNGGCRSDRIPTMLGRLHWLVTFSAKFQPKGPWIDFSSAHALGGSQKGIQLQPRNSSDEWRGLAYPFWHPGNDKGRKGLAKNLLSRLPGLRVLSVDLGHRYAAACAVWQALDAASFDMNKTIKAAKAEGATVEGSPDGLFVHITRKVTKEKRGKKWQAEQRTIYRRIGADEIEVTDKKTGEVAAQPHPAPWARLDRQFLIKLQGEHRGDIRAALRNESAYVRELETSVGYVRDTQNTLPCAVDELMAEAVRTVRLALRRHADYARIAWGLTAQRRLLMGGGVAQRLNSTAPTRNGHQRRLLMGGGVAQQDMTKAEIVEHLQDVLMTWYDLAHAQRWKDEWAAQQWQSELAAMPGYQEPPAPDEDATGPQRRKQRERMRESFKPLAEALAARDRRTLARSWKEQWAKNDAAWSGRLKRLRRWLMPRGLREPKGEETDEQHRARVARRKAARCVGGLSLNRIATIRQLWQVQKAFHYRATPDNLRAGVELNEEESRRGYRFGDRMLQAMERMREQRVKQLASRIAEAALGIGSENREHWQQGKRPRKPINDPRFAPCHAVVIENLTNYRPEETRVRRENRQLMNWSAAKVKKYVSEACQLHGLHLREVTAAYTSRQDSRTGQPGLRCEDVPLKEFVSSAWWTKTVNAARKRVGQDRQRGTAEDRLLVAAHKHCTAAWQSMSEAEKKTCPPVRLPRKGGDLFVSVDGRSLQADLNAAANIGLRALLDPDFAGRWWYVRFRADTGKPDPDKVKGSAAVPIDLSLGTANAATGKRGKTLEIANLWRDCSTKPLQTPPTTFSSPKDITLWRDCSTKPLQTGEFQGYEQYWNGVRCRVVKALAKNASGEAMPLVLETPF